MPPTLVWRTDVHLSDRTPRSRKDDWTETVLEKLRQVGQIAREVDACAVLDGGDFFDVKSPQRNSHALVRATAEVHKAYPCPVYANVGNHDCVYGDIEFLPQQPLGVLFATGIFQRLYNEHEAVFEQDGVKVRVVGIPYHGTKYDLSRFANLKKGDEDHLVVIGHQLASPAGGAMFEGEDIIKYADLMGLPASTFCFLPGTKVVDALFRVHDIETLQEETPILGRDCESISIEQMHPVRHVSEGILHFNLEGVPPELITGVTKEHPFWVSQDQRCYLPSRKTRRCHPDKGQSSYPCNVCKQPRKCTPTWVPAGEIQSGDYFAIPVPQIPESTLSVPGLARLLGLYLSEGHIICNAKKEPKGGVGWTFHEDEKHLHEMVSKLLLDNFGLQAHFSLIKDSKAIQITAFGKEITDFCYTNGDRYSYGKELSSWVWSLSAPDRLEVLLGWLAGDGHARNPARYSRIKVEVMGSTVSPNLASQMFYLALSIGLHPYYFIRPEGHTTFNKGCSNEYLSETLPAHILSFYGDDADMLAEKLGVPFPKRTKTKVSSFFQDGLYFVRVRNVRETHYEGPVYNMRTSTQEYIAGLVLTHNCFGHWHKDQGVTEIAPGQHIVNVGSLTRGSLHLDDLDRKPCCVVMKFTKQTVEYEVRPLQIQAPEVIFDLETRNRVTTRAAQMSTFVASLQATLQHTSTTPLQDIVRGMELETQVKERVLLLMEQ